MTSSKRPVHEALKCPKCGGHGTADWSDADIFDDGTGFLVMRCTADLGFYGCRASWTVDITGIKISDDWNDQFEEADSKRYHEENKGYSARRDED